MTTTINHLRQTRGIAGQFSVICDVFTEGEPSRQVEFIGSSYGGPVIMRTGSIETFVTDPDRFGAFGKQWVQRFFAAADDA